MTVLFFMTENHGGTCMRIHVHVHVHQTWVQALECLCLSMLKYILVLVLKSSFKVLIKQFLSALIVSDVIVVEIVYCITVLKESCA